MVGGRRRVVGEGGEVATLSWSLCALNDGVGGVGEAFTVKKREVTRMSLLAHDAPGIAEPGRNDGPGVPAPPVYVTITRLSVQRPLRRRPTKADVIDQRGDQGKPGRMYLDTVARINLLRISCNKLGTQSVSPIALSVTIPLLPI
jgi:hypothetical protein